MSIPTPGRAAMAAALLACLACSGGDTPSSGTPGSAGADGKKIFRHFRSSEHKSLDPVKQFDQASHELIANLYDTLLEYDYLARPYQIVPGLLERMPDPEKERRP